MFAKVKLINQLAVDLCHFAMSIDWWGFCDAYDSAEQFISETEQGLWDPKRRKGIAADLKGMAEEMEPEEAEVAAKLYRQVIAI